MVLKPTNRRLKVTKKQEMLKLWKDETDDAIVFLPTPYDTAVTSYH